MWGSTSAQVAPVAPAQSPLQPTSITLKANTPFATAGSWLTLSGVVSPTASGTVIIYDGANEIGRTFVSYRGTYQLVIGGANSLSVGIHSLTAVYLGNATFNASGSVPLTEYVWPHW